MTLATALCTLLLVTSCGDDSEPDDDAGPDRESSSTPTSEETVEETPEAPATDPETVIQDYFAAQRVGDAAAICAFEDDTFETFKYGEPGQPCLDDLANNQAQPVWADPVVVVSLEESEGTATAVLEPNAGSSAQATMTLTAVDGEWLVSAFS